MRHRKYVTHDACIPEQTRRAGGAVSFWAYLAGRHQQLLADAFQHASAVFQCMVLATVLGVLVGEAHLSERVGGIPRHGHRLHPPAPSPRSP